MYLSTQSLPLDSSLLCSDSQNIKELIYWANTLCYGPSIISVTVTKGGHARGGGLYGTSRTMGQGVAESRGKFST